ncbi:hypothetical protein MMC12_005367 [Toensbergia leucococca]|nr:hypothetical protein [Toensbergia leucococca]
MIDGASEDPAVDQTEANMRPMESTLIVRELNNPVEHPQPLPFVPVNVTAQHRYGLMWHAEKAGPGRKSLTHALPEKWLGCDGRLLPRGKKTRRKIQHYRFGRSSEGLVEDYATSKSRLSLRLALDSNRFVGNLVTFPTVSQKLDSSWQGSPFVEMKMQ